MKNMVIIGSILWIFSSCTFNLDEPGACPYNVRLDYRYAGSPDNERLSAYIDHIRQYVFDEQGVLVTSWQQRGDSLSCWQGQLPAGHYTLVCWGNLGQESTFNTEPIAGVTQLRELMLTSAHGTGADGYRDNTERLYYGHCTLDVAEGMSTARVVYLTHCHAVMRITVRWAADPPPFAASGYTLRLRGVPSEYGFPMGYDIALPNGKGAFTFPTIGSPTVWHKARAGMNYSNELVGELVTYRFTSGTHPLLSIYRGEARIMKEIDFQLFFRKLAVGLDENTEQEFDLLVTIDGTKIVVTQMTGSDWTEGGGLG